MRDPYSIVIALGGNALLRQDGVGSFQEQYDNVVSAARAIAELVKMGYKKLAITHGNGPQVGATLLRHQMAKDIVPAFPLHACNAETQGLIGYMIAQALQNELDRRKIVKAVVSVVTRIQVDRDDRAFRDPTKPVGPFFEKNQYPNLTNIFEGYKQGAKMTNPNIKVIGAHIGDWDSPAKGKEAGLAQISAGADFLLHVADTSGHGVIEAAKEKGVYAFGAVADQNGLASGTVLTSFVLDIDKAFDQAMQMVVENRFDGKLYRPGIEAAKGAPGAGIVYLAPFHDLGNKVPEAIKTKLQQLTQDVIDKNIVVLDKIGVRVETAALSYVPSNSISSAEIKTLKVALVTDALFGDGGWGATAHNAAKLLETKYGHLLACQDNVAIPDIESTLRQYAEKGYDLIIAHGFQWGDPAVKVGRDYPDTKFVVFTGLVSSNNVASIFPMQQEGTFLLGALAGMMSRTGVIGYVGGDQVDPLLEGNASAAIKYQRNSKYRRVVPSPKPSVILESQVIRSLLDSGFLVIACGGGGIPVIEEADGSKAGIDAVIDKDLASEKLATQIGAGKLVILTDVEGLYTNYGEKNQKLLSEVKVHQGVDAILSEVEEGSMGPKVRACINFVRNGGHEAIIANLENLSKAIEGRSGTRFFTR